MDTQHKLEEKKSSLLSESYIQFTGPLIIFLGVIKIQMYYGEFGINILQFIAIGEALTSFLDFIILIVIYFLTLFTTIFFLDGKPDSTASETFQKILNAGSFIKRLKYYVYDIVQMIFQFIFIAASYFVMNYLSNRENSIDDFFNAVTVLCCVTIIVIVFKELKFKNHAYNRSKDERSIIYVTFFSLLIILFVVFSSYKQAKAVRDNKIYNGVVIELTNDSTFYSTDKVYYIGKTNDYVFIHDEKRKQTEVIPTSSIKSIVFPTRN